MRSGGNPCFDDGDFEMTPKSDREEANFLPPTENGFGKNSNHHCGEKRKSYLPESGIKKGHYIAGTFIAVIALAIAVSLVTWYLLSRENSISQEQSGKPLLNASLYNKQGLPDPGKRVIIKHLMTPTPTPTPRTNRINSNNVTLETTVGKIVTTETVKIDVKFLKELKDKVDTILCTEKSSGSSQDDHRYTLAQKNTNILWEMFNKHDGWIMQGPENLNLTVKSALIESINKHIFRLRAKVKIPADQLFVDLIENVEKAPKWNPTVKHMQVLHTVNKCTDIIYQVSAEMADGYVTSRDFVSLRNWERRGDVLLASVNAIEFEGMPPMENYTRGEFFNGGMVFEKIPGDPNSCMFYWFFNADMKGWIPPVLLEIGLVDAMIEYLVFLEDHIKNLKANVKY